MNVNEAIRCAETYVHSSVGNTLATEIKRLRNHRELLYDAIPVGPTRVDEMHLISKEVEDERQKKEKKEKTQVLPTRTEVDEAIESAEIYSHSPHSPGNVLATEIKRLRKFTTELRRGGDKERNHLRGVIENRDEKIEELRERLDILGNMVKEVSKEFGTYARSAN